MQFERLKIHLHTTELILGRNNACNSNNSSICRMRFDQSTAKRCRTPERCLGGVLLSPSCKPLSTRRSKCWINHSSLTNGQYHARPTVTFPVKGHHRPLIGTNLYAAIVSCPSDVI